MPIINPKEIPVNKMHGLLLGSVVPRPIAFVSTISANEEVNLSPFSFFNAFSTNPPILIFSASRRGRDNTTKHTLDNVLEVPEAVINIVSYGIVHQASLASAEYPRGVNEFTKAKFTEEKSLMVKPPRVKESPVSFECKVNQVVPLGNQGAAGNLVICEVLLMHLVDKVMDENGRIDPWKLDAVARMGQDYYCRAQGENIFMVPKPGDKPKIGIDGLPQSIRTSPVFTDRDLAILANIEKLPFEGEGPKVLEDKLRHVLAKENLDRGDASLAWKVLLNEV